MKKIFRYVLLITFALNNSHGSFSHLLFVTHMKKRRQIKISVWHTIENTKVRKDRKERE